MTRNIAKPGRRATFALAVVVGLIALALVGCSGSAPYSARRDDPGNRKTPSYAGQVGLYDALGVAVTY